MRIECILLKFHWGMKALIELHFQHEAPRFIENVLRSTLSYPNETATECIQFLNIFEENFTIHLYFVLESEKAWCNVLKKHSKLLFIIICYLFMKLTNILLLNNSS